MRGQLLPGKGFLRSEHIFGTCKGELARSRAHTSLKSTCHLTCQQFTISPLTLNQLLGRKARAMCNESERGVGEEGVQGALWSFAVSDARSRPGQHGRFNMIGENFERKRE